MSTPITLKEKMGQQVSAGTHVAICHRIVYVGTQPDTGYGANRKLIVFWELPHERIEVDGKDKPMGISKIYNLGSSGGMNKKSALRQDLAAWRGRDFTAEELKGFELRNILGKGCQVTVEHNEEGRAKCTKVVGLSKGIKIEPAINPLVEYSIADGKTDVFERLPDWVKTMCSACLEWKHNGDPNEPDMSVPVIEPDPDEEDVPF